jgi:uncharacterized membrane protein
MAVGPSSATRVAVAAVPGAIAGAGAAIAGPWWLAPLTAWDVAALVYLVWIWAAVGPLGPEATAAVAQRETPGRAAADLILLLASVVSLLAIGLVVIRAGDRAGSEKDLLVGLGVVSILLSWSVVHTVYTLTYAKLYHLGGGGIDFNEDDPPAYLDFAYVALTVGMTFQIADTDLRSKPMRRAALRHALLSYVFGTLIIAATINLVVGLSA